METKGGIEEFNLAFDFILELFPQKANAYIVDYPYDKVVSLYKEHGDVFSTRYITRNLPYLPPLPRREVDESFLSLEEIKPYLSRSTFRLLSSRAEEIGFINALKEMLDSKSNYIINNSIEPSSFNKEAKLIETKNIYSFFVADQKSIARKANKADLENELTRINYEIDSLTTQLRSWDRLVDYSTVCMDVYELSPDRPSTTTDDFSTKVSVGFKSTLTGLGKFFEGFAIFMISASPVIAVLAAVAIAVIVIVKLCRKRRAKKRAAAAEKTDGMDKKEE